jgi:hypothetical protein
MGLAYWESFVLMNGKEGAFNFGEKSSLHF